MKIMECVTEKPQLSLYEKYLRSAKMFLNCQGYRILDESWECPAGKVDLVAKDDDALVFVEVIDDTEAKSKKTDETPIEKKREAFEQIVIAYISSHDIGECAVRADEISFLARKKDRALLKHHINVLSC